MGVQSSVSLLMIKASRPFIQIKANLKITTCLTPWGPKPFLLTKNQSLVTSKTQYKSLSSTQKSTNHILPLELKLQNKSPFIQDAFSQFRSQGVEIRVQENLPSPPHNLSLFPLLTDYGRSLGLVVYFFCIFLYFSYGILIFLVKAPLAFVCYTL